MSTNLPVTIPDLLAWAEAHGPLWTTNQAQIGLSAAQVTAFNEMVGDFRTNYDAAQNARLASKNATEKMQDGIVGFRATAGAFINMVKAYAETTDNPDVYVLAGVSPDAPPGELPPPNAPETFTATLSADGSITLKWKVAQPPGVTGVQYNVHRRYAAGEAFTLIGSAGSAKTYTDVTLPYGTDTVQYMIQPKRGEVFGNQSPAFTLQFGTNGPGLTATVKMAA